MPKSSTRCCLQRNLLRSSRRATPNGSAAQQGDYTLTLTIQADAASAEFLNLPRGALEVRLLWNTAADLQLLVRDPAGNSVYDDVPQIRSGGQMAAAGNVNCRVPTGTPFSYIYWPTDTPPRAGVYEVRSLVPERVQ